MAVASAAAAQRVTDTACAHGDTSDSRNGTPMGLVEAESLIHHLTDGKQPTDAEREQRMRRYRARKTAEVCGACGQALARSAPIWRTRLGQGTGLFGWSPGALTPVCSECRPTRWVEWWPTTSCETCGRAVTTEVISQAQAWTHAFCSEHCSSSWYTARRNERAAEARRKRCEVCDEIFDATRLDALTCSPGCRQRAYRRRRSNERRGGRSVPEG
jgi:hypothetical protein